MKQTLEPIIAPSHQHIPNVTHDLARLSFNWGPVISHSKACVGLPSGANLQPVLTSLLEEHCHTVVIRVGPRTPIARRELGSGDIVIMEKTHSRLSISAIDIVSFSEEVLWKS